MADDNTGAMLAFLPHGPQFLAVDGGDPPEELHVTMLYLGDDHTVYGAQHRHDISQVLSALGTGPVTATVTAVQTLGSNEPPATVMMLDGPDLHALRPTLKQALADAGVPVPEDTYPEYLPHLTLGYGLNPDDYQSRVGEILTLDRVGAWYGPDRAEVPLTEETRMGDRFYAEIARMGVPTGDRRIIAPGALTYRDLPRALRWQEFDAPGHEGSVVIGRIDSIDIDNATGLATAYGELLDPDVIPEVVRARELIRNGVLGISIDAGQVEYEDMMDGWTMFTRYEIAAFTALPIAAFASTPIYLVGGEPAAVSVEDIPDESVGEGEYGLTAAAGRFPPLDLFSDPQFETYTPLMITEVDGFRRLTGHIAPLDVPHRGLPGQVYAPRTTSGYREFLLGGTMTAEGVLVPTGPVTIGGGHAATNLNAQAAVEHYDDAGTRAASVTIGEDDFGIWISGVIKDGVADADAYSLLEFPPSGDWRADQFGNLELILIHQVNTPGFPVYRVNQDMASGQVYALVASADAWKGDPVTPFAVDLDGDLEAQFAEAGVDWPQLAMTLGGVQYGPVPVAAGCVLRMLRGVEPSMAVHVEIVSTEPERARAKALLAMAMKWGM